jgi:hypothetical protein
VRAGKPELRVLPGVFASLAIIGAGMREPSGLLPPDGMFTLSELAECKDRASVTRGIEP